MKAKWIIEGLHSGSGQWVRFGRTEIMLDENQVAALVIDMMRDTQRESSFRNMAYDPRKFDAFRAVK